jgi:glycosyltransferase involved in cell wall biosynthesis
MNIWLVTVGEPLPGVDPDNPRLMRTAVLARCLSERGHSVIWWTSTFDHSRKRQRRDKDDEASWNGVTIRMLRGVGYKANVSLRRFVDHANVAAKFRRAARNVTPPDLILASLPTLELALEAVRYGQSNGVPVLLDVRDLWPDAIHQLLPRALQPLSRAALYWLKRTARAALRGCTGIIGISRGYLDWGLRYANRAEGPSDGLFPLGYVAPAINEQQLAAAEHRLRQCGVDPTRTLCWYVGSFGRQYDLEPVLTAAGALGKIGRNDVQFVISGEGEQGQRWRALGENLTNVVFTGWIAGSEIGWLRSHVAIGLQPYVLGAPQGLANKLFEYLSAGIPVLSSLSGENAALIAENECGLSYAAGDAKSFEVQLTRLLDAPQARLEMGLRAGALFRQRFDADRVVHGLADHLEYVANHWVPIT